MIEGGVDPEVLRRGEQPAARARKPKSTAALAQGRTAVMDTGGGVEAGDPAAVRPALAQLAADNLTELQRSVLDAAVSAVRPVWLTVTCGDCGATSRIEAPVPDMRARLQAVELLLREGLGRAPQAEEKPAPKLPATAAAVNRMSWEELQLLAATLFADKIAAVESWNGLELLQEQLSRLSKENKQALRVALADNPA